MTEELIEQSDQADQHDGASRLVPVGESIKYRRRAQQAEARSQEIEQQLAETQAQMQSHQEQLATAEAQRDEAGLQLTVAENRLNVERMLGAAGVVDIETAGMLLAKRLDLSEPVEPGVLVQNVEQLLLDKPFLHNAPTGSLPSGTASASPHRPGMVSQITQAANRAVETGDRKDVAEYLRLRRQASPPQTHA